jgi:hypothetical protein
VAARCHECDYHLECGDCYRCRFRRAEADRDAANSALAIVRVASGAAAGESTLARVEWLVSELGIVNAALGATIRHREAADARVAELEAALKAERDANAPRGRVLPGSVVRVELEAFPPVTHALPAESPIVAYWRQLAVPAGAESIPPHPLPVGSDPAFDGTFPAPGGGRSAGRVTQGEGA